MTIPNIVRKSYWLVLVILVNFEVFTYYWLKCRAEDYGHHLKIDI